MAIARTLQTVSIHFSRSSLNTTPTPVLFLLATVGGGGIFFLCGAKEVNMQSAKVTAVGRNFVAASHMVQALVDAGVQPKAQGEKLEANFPPLSLIKFQIYRPGCGKHPHAGGCGGCGFELRDCGCHRTEHVRTEAASQCSRGVDPTKLRQSSIQCLFCTPQAAVISVWMTILGLPLLIHHMPLPAVTFFV
jgi:hypothetical protein